MENTPLYDALRAFAAARPLRMHMPGHKGRPLPAPELAGLSALDFTELPPTGDLFSGGDAIEAAEALWAKAFHMAHCLFLTGGATQGVQAALALACRPGDAVLLDRGSHRSAYNALALLDLRPVYLERPWLPQAGVTGPIDPAAVEAALKTRPDIKTVCITSPTYYGVLSDLPALAAVCRAHGAVLVVDGAHGAHLPFLGNFDLAAADLAVVSAHKTLPAPGQSALLLAGGSRTAGASPRPTADALASRRFTQAELRWAASLTGSSSPSYVLMAALDVCRAYMEAEGAAAYRETAEAVAALRRHYPSLTEGDAPLDPARFVLRCSGGFAAQERMEALGVWPEMADAGHVVFIPTCADTPAGFARLAGAISRVNPPPTGDSPFPPPPPLPRLVCSPRAARFAPWETVPFAAAEGRVSAAQIAPYPPGVPVIAPGEEIGKKHLAYLSEIGYNMEKEGCRVLCL